MNDLQHAASEVNLDLPGMEPWLRAMVIQDCLPFMDFAQILLDNDLFLLHKPARKAYKNMCVYDSSEKTVIAHANKYIKEVLL